MKIEDIDFESGFIRIPAGNTKINIGRTFIPIGILNKVKAYLKQTRRNKGLLFGLTKRRTQQLVEKYSRRSGHKCLDHKGIKRPRKAIIFRASPHFSLVTESKKTLKVNGHSGMSLNIKK